MIKTTCQECVHAIVQDGIQTGCVVGVLDKFRTKELVRVEEKAASFYEVGGVCHLLRREKDERLSSSSYITCHFIVVYNGVYEDLQKTVESISLVSQKKPFRLLILMRMSQGIPSKSQVEQLKFDPTMTDFVLVNDEILYPNGQIGEACKRIKNGLIFIVPCGELVSSDCADKANYYYIYVSDSVVGISGSIRCYIAMLLKGYTEEGLIKECQDNPESDRLIVSWEEVNEAYRLSQEEKKSSRLQFN
jgi:hypothetical protein